MGNLCKKKQSDEVDVEKKKMKMKIITRTEKQN